MFYVIKEGLLKCGLYLQGGLYSEVAFNTGWTVFRLALVHPSVCPKFFSFCDRGGKVGASVSYGHISIFYNFLHVYVLVVILRIYQKIFFFLFYVIIIIPLNPYPAGTGSD